MNAKIPTSTIQNDITQKPVHRKDKHHTHSKHLQIASVSSRDPLRKTENKLPLSAKKFQHRPYGKLNISTIYTNDDTIQKPGHHTHSKNLQIASQCHLAILYGKYTSA